MAAVFATVSALSGLSAPRAGVRRERGFELFQPWPSWELRQWMAARNAAIDRFRARHLPGETLRQHLEDRDLAKFEPAGVR